jgi:predicted enzyme related to lactoylglutathione lyase
VGTFINARMSWLALLAPSAKAATDSYRNLFGWNFEKMEGQEGCSLASNKRGIKPFASLIQAEPDGQCAPGWSVYCSIEDSVTNMAGTF